ncbi:hypothetical protein [Escherichia fergusonii]|uniref:Uncharacterized protein n=2 Tax=Escherichia fergusonii TaxID=564 RepID=A0A7W3HYY2_ESCFE|nr:hypothetical protein [Escherichia fergusonii]EHG6165306.1 hypothetical protein [Escherichia fergusonii]EHG7563797.1 hypothetical protein [Escherichia fergusonii]MBA8236832.1 hypothetical protein [Escherichia fergusonii]MBA8244452.1 hypothetical protein [Escherichia fergusonii]QLM07947.1 hypothetical protein HVV50_09400 [Escherichia fergusonii]
MINIPLTAMGHQPCGEFVSCSVSFNGQISVLEVDQIPERIQGMFVSTITEERTWYITLYGIKPHYARKINIHDAYNFHKIQFIDNQHILLVGARSRFENGEGEKNAAIYTMDGRLVRRFTLGDGIEDVSVTEKGEIWVSYFDEGVFGNFGWQIPMGQNGLVKYDLYGNVLWEQNECCIFDCYTLNVDNAASVWFYYYADFELVHIKNSTFTRYEIPVEGMSCFAVCLPWIIADNGYQQSYSFSVFRQDGQRFKKHDDIVFTQPGGRQIDPVFRKMRGKWILVMTETELYYGEIAPSIFY